MGDKSDLYVMSEQEQKAMNEALKSSVDYVDGRDTPRTDAEENSMKVFGNDYMVPSDFARQLERELAAMTSRTGAAEADARRLDYLQKHCTGHLTANGFVLGVYQGPTLRDAIDAAIKESKGGDAT